MGAKLDELLDFLDGVAREVREDGEDPWEYDAIARALRAVDALHQPDDGAGLRVGPFPGWTEGICPACGTGWPCPTARALGR